MDLEGFASFQRSPSSIGGATAIQDVLSMQRNMVPVRIPMAAELLRYYSSFTAASTVIPYIQTPSRDVILQASASQQD